MGFLAAIGIQAAFDSEDRQPRLWWNDSAVTPHAVVDDEFGVDQIADQVVTVASRWKDSVSANPKRSDDSRIPKGDDLKFSPEDIRVYLNQATQAGLSGSDLAMSLVAEGSLDNQGVAKPSDLYFTAGQQKFLDVVRRILDSVVHEDVVAGLVGQWAYTSEIPSLGWDVADDRVYALRANNPSPEKKLTNPGPEALSIFGLSRHPVFAGCDRTLTQGCSGTWKSGHYSWPLWRRPATPNAVRSLLSHAYDHLAKNRLHWYPSWGVSMVLRSPIRRSGQGGYGTFGPSAIVWQHS